MTTRSTSSPTSMRCPPATPLALVIYAYEPDGQLRPELHHSGGQRLRGRGDPRERCPPTSTIRTYSDVASTDWFYDGVKYVSDREIMTGMDEGIFAPKATPREPSW